MTYYVVIRASMSRSDPGASREAAMSAEISWIFVVEVNPDALDDITALIKEMVETNRAAEPETLGYLWFITADGRFVHVYERYTNSEAAQLHLTRFAENFASRLLTLSRVAGLTV